MGWLAPSYTSWMAAHHAAHTSMAELAAANVWERAIPSMEGPQGTQERRLRPNSVKNWCQNSRICSQSLRKRVSVLMEMPLPFDRAVACQGKSGKAARGAGGKRCARPWPRWPSPGVIEASESHAGDSASPEREPPRSGVVCEAHEGSANPKKHAFPAYLLDICGGRFPGHELCGLGAGAALWAGGRESRASK